MVHERQADHVIDFPLRFVVWQRLQFLRSDNVAVRSEHARFIFAHLLADFCIVKKIIYAVRQVVQLRQEIIIRIKFSEIFIRMNVCKHLTAIHIGSQHHQFRYGNDAAVLLHMLVGLHLQKSFQRCFLPFIQFG